VSVEAHDGSSWTSQAQMDYDGLGQRLSMTGFAGGQSLTTQYALDGSRVLSADADGYVTTYLYGLGPIGQLTDTWAYGLPDGSGTQRQLVDPQGEITLAASYTPWGDTLSVTGTGAFTYGYFGGIMDTTTGLLYVGNGQYYDPATGRFINRNVNPESANPYVPVGWGANRRPDRTAGAAGHGIQPQEAPRQAGYVDHSAGAVCRCWYDPVSL
jgi:RHS repeat-associated protein